MAKMTKLIEELRYRHEDKHGLGNYDSASRCGFRDKDDACEKLQADIDRMITLQDRLSAQKRYGILLVLQGMDTAGKDGAIKHVMSGVDTQGVSVHSFRAPTQEESLHDYLWRSLREIPERGRIGIFNRSHYENVLVTKVHPELLGEDRHHAESQGEKFWDARYQDINNLEAYLVRNRILVVKCFLHLSKDEQRERLLSRVDDPSKQWKFSLADLAQRPFWDEYTAAYQRMLAATSTNFAPWYVIPADHKWVARLAIADILVNVLEGLHLEYPPLSEDVRKALTAQRAALQK